MHTRNRGRARRPLLTLLIFSTVLAAGFGTMLLSILEQVTPQIGDIVVFAANTSRAEPSGIRIAVHRPGQSGCVLDLDTIRRTGGSLVVEARLMRPISGFRVHWAGERTGAETEDCGASADMVLGRGDLTSLSMEAGSYGPGYRRNSMIASTAAD
jgi:hypothetical protein